MRTRKIKPLDLMKKREWGFVEVWKEDGQLRNMWTDGAALFLDTNEFKSLSIGKYFYNKKQRILVPNGKNVNWKEHACLDLANLTEVIPLRENGCLVVLEKDFDSAAYIIFTDKKTERKRCYMNINYYKYMQQIGYKSCFYDDKEEHKEKFIFTDEDDKLRAVVMAVIFDI